MGLTIVMPALGDFGRRKNRYCLKNALKRKSVAAHSIATHQSAREQHVLRAYQDHVLFREACPVRIVSPTHQHMDRYFAFFTRLTEDAKVVQPGAEVLLRLFDWSLLIDGSADPKHYDLLRKIGSVVDTLAAKPPGPEGTFGKMVFSHGLIHEIGGEDDSNLNTTRRLLLLLESRAVGRDVAYNNVVRGILDRYLLEDRGFWRGSGHRVPRFLQNDFARCWRTMTVDFAYKLRNRGGKGWAIRNIKLRMSRKLLYISGLLACYRCHLDYDETERVRVYADPDTKHEVIERLQSIFRATPLEIVSEVLLRFPHLDGTATKVLGAYDGFVGILSDSQQRKRLEDLKEEDADDDETYQKARSMSHDFRDGLLEFFFDEKSDMCNLTKNYGVF